MKLADDLREFVALLNSAGVEYLIVLGHAVGYHGYPRYTGDVDIFIRRSPGNAARVASVLGSFGFGGLGADAETFQKSDVVVQMGRPPNRIDILTTISGVQFDDAWQTREQALVDGVPAPMIGRDALIANKRASGRQKDLADLHELDKIK